MPDPTEGETREHFMERCVPMVMDDGAAEGNDQAVAMCSGMFEQAHKALEPDSLVYFGEAVKALGDGRVGGYLVRFSTADDPDLTGEYFTKDTDFGEHETAPVYFEHGLDPVLKTRKIGKAVHTKDDFGIWAEAQLELRDNYEKFIYHLTEQGKIGWSSGTHPYLIEREQVGKARWVKLWQLGLDDTLTTHPAEYKNSVIPLKSLFPQAAEGEAETGGEPVRSESGSVEVEPEPIEVVTTKGVTEMDITEEKLSELIDAAADKALKAYTATLPTNGDGGLAAPQVAVVTDEADQPFETDGHFFKAVKNAALYPSDRDVRLRSREIKATGLSEGVPADGGYLLTPQLSGRILERMYTNGQLLSRVAQDPIGPNSNSMLYNGINETSRADGSRWGGVLGYWLAEAGTKTATKPAFRQMELKLKKVAALCYSTDEQLEDTTNLQSWLNRVVPDELRFQAENAIMNGNGLGKPLGIMNSPCLITVQRDTASRILTADVLAMWARRWGGVNDYVWYTGQDSFIQLPQLILGTTVALFMPPGGLTSAPFGTLLGRPVIETEFNPALNTTGDIMLASMSQYQTINKGGVQAASSIHVQFLTDETAFRFVYRIDGQPSWNSALTPFNGSGTQSPFVVLGSASA
jgi:HK97 family phage major capsid protein